MNKIMVKSVLVIFFMSLLCQPVSAQRKSKTKQSSKSQPKTENLAHAGPTGIFVNLGLEIGSKQFPSNKIVGYKVERKTDKDKNWQTISTVSAPEDYQEFLSRIAKADKLMRDSIPLNEIPLEKIWEDAQKYKRLDSLKYLGSLLIVRLALGNAYFDSSAVKNQKYGYRISQIDEAGKELSSFTTSEVSYPPELEPEKITFYSKETYDNYVNVAWKIENGNRPVQLDIFRRTNLEGDFVKIQPVRILSSEKTGLIITCRDTLVNPGEVYQYYLSPIDYYQNIGVPSDTIVAAAFNINSVIPPYEITAVGSDSLGGIKLNWHIDHPQKILSLKIYRSTDFEKNYAEIAEVTSLDSIYIDRTAEPMIKYFYYLVMTDAVGEKSPNSAKVFGIYKSSEVPFPPLNLRSDSTKNGVKLIWEKPGAFVNVYHIYRNLGDSNTLLLIDNVHSDDSLITFVDTTSTLSGNEVYLYAVQSETSSGILGRFSDTISVVPKSKTTLRAPRELKGYLEESKVFLYWENLFKNDPSIDGYMVFRLDKNSKSKKPEFKALRDSLISPKENNYVDSTVIPGNNYQYAVQAVDVYGNKSPISSVINVEVEPRLPSAPANITAETTTKGILVSWNAPLEQDIKEFKVFRYERGQTPILLGKVDFKHAYEFLDKRAKKGILFFYYLISVDNFNYESKPSNEVGIRR